MVLYQINESNYKASMKNIILYRKLGYFTENYGTLIYNGKLDYGLWKKQTIYGTVPKNIEL